MVPCPPFLRRLLPPRHRLLLATLAVASVLPAIGSAAPAHVLITAGTGTAAQRDLPGQLAAWRADGAVSDAFIVESDGAKDAAFGVLAVLEFPDAADLDHWRQNEAKALGAGAAITDADLVESGETFPRDSTKAVFLAAEYDVKASPERYRAYAGGYITPEMEALRRANVLTSHFLFAARNPGATPWPSVLLMEYRDPQALAGRATSMAAVRQGLEADPSWREWSRTKQSVRSERTLTRASWVLLPPPALAGLPPYRAEYRVTGTIRVLGSFLKYTTQALEDAFVHYQPDAQFANNFSTSSEGAIGGLATGISDLAPAGDDAKITDLMPFANANGYLPTEISVATGDYEKRGALWPAAILVNRDNPLTHVTRDELDRIFGAERTGGWDVGDNPTHEILFTARYARGPETNLRTWDQLGLGGEWAGKPIQTYGYVAPGFTVYFERKVLHWSDKYNGNFREYVEPKEAEAGPEGKPVSVLTMLDTLSHDRFGIGWAAMFHAKDYPALKTLAVAARPGGPYVAYTPQNVANRTYPLVRDAYFYVNKEPGRPLDPKVREFMRFVLSREGQQVIAHTGFYYPLPAAYLEAQLRKLD